MSALASASSSALSAPAAAPPPRELLTPAYILRAHAAQISALAFSERRNYLYSGDIDGWVGVWDLRTFRPVWFWKAHSGGVLTLSDFSLGLLSHARDNTLHYFPLPPSPPSIRPAGAASATPSVARPTPIEAEWTLPVNAMAYCKMGLLSLGKGKGKEEEGLVAVPALTKDELIDIFHVPSLLRVHRSIGANAFAIGDKTGTIMALQLFLSPSFSSTETTSQHPSTLHLLAAYEDGRVALFHFTGSPSDATAPMVDGKSRKREEGEGWDLVWEEKGHREAVMSLAVSEDKRTGWSVGADHFVCRYELFDGASEREGEGGAQREGEEVPPRMQKIETTAAGRSEVRIRDNGKLVVVAGWDGETRLYSAKTGAPLAVLSYHRSSLHALALANVLPRARTGEEDEDESDSDSDSDAEEGAQRRKGGRAWLAMGGKDERISLWEVYPPGGDQVVKRGA